MSYLFIGRYEKCNFVDVFTFDSKANALDYYLDQLAYNENGYNHIELLEQTATHYFTKIEENMI